MPSSALEEETKDIDFRRDPFFKSQRGPLSGPSLEGIIWDSKKPIAIINDEILEVGDQIKGYTVIEIRVEEVILRDDQDQSRLRLELFK